MKLLDMNIFERLISQRIVTISEVVNSLFGLNPNTKVKDLPSEYAEHVQEIKKVITRNIRSLDNSYLSTSTELNADLAFGAAYLFIDEDLTPKEVIDRTHEAIISYLYTNKWEEIMFAFGGRILVDDMAKIRKSGRGLHRKDDEQKSTEKIIGLLIMLLAQKQQSGNYGTIEKPTISEIYADILTLIDNQKLTTKGIGKSTFYSKVRAAVSTASQADD